MRKYLFAGCLVTALGMILSAPAIAACGEGCDADYSSAIDDCHSQYGDDPADAEDLANCVQEARDDYRSCLDDCPNAAISLPGWRGLGADALAMPIRSLCAAEETGR